MKSIIIDDYKIMFNNPGNIGISGKQENFSIDLNRIKVVGIKFMYLIDDDEYFIVLIDSIQKTYFLNSAFFDELSFKKLQEVFNIKLDIANFDDNYYKQGKSIILYPYQLYGKPLFKKENFFSKTTTSFFNKLFAFRNPAWGHLSDESKAVIASNV